MKKLIVYGGSFDPFHLGHKNVIEKCIKTFNLSKILITLTTSPPHKEFKILTDYKKRLEIIKLSMKNFKNKESVSIYYGELKSDKSYTIDTLKKVKNDYLDMQVCLLIGSDLFLNFEIFKNYKEIIKNFTLIVFLRDFKHKKIVKEKFKKLSSYFIVKEVIFINDFVFEISSSEIREKILKESFNKDLYKFLDKNVIEYIINNNLYGCCNYE